MFIAISQRNDKNKHGDYIDNLENNYVDYLEKFGIKLIAIPNCSENVDVYFKEFPISGIILSGVNNVNPGLYGKKMNELLAVSKKRDETEKKMLEIAIKNKLPVLGICRGMQFINVFFKSKLIKIKEESKNEIEHVASNHQVIIFDEKFTRELGNEIEVNSYHHQGVNSDTLSSELKAFAKSYDGIIEGFYHTSLPIVGIQWHPERKSPNEEVNNKIIKAFLNKELFWKK